MALLNLEIDGKPIQVANGTTVIEAAHKLGLFVPHFCYHKKLSIAANCRMCLVQVEKAPKPLPACATPVTEGMKVWTHSDTAVDAQKGVMEFLLINHPLDCPICDQGGECQLQDLAVGYGSSSSRYDEPKRVVLNKYLGPLIATDMTRCIHCTRCVRFGQEIAGIMELGMAGRGEFSEIMSFVGRTVDSEISGNMIDLCPVGALTSKPFRYTARPWELSRRKSISPHDSLGSNLNVNVKQDRVMRVLPFENEAINECWLSDRDRFSYEGLNAEDRLRVPMVRRDGALVETDWQSALEHVVARLDRVRTEHGAEAIGALGSPHSTLEELYLLQKLVRGLGSDNVDFRLRLSETALTAGIPWLGMSIAELAGLDRVLVVGSFLRKDHPLLAQRLRQSAKKGAQVSIVHATEDELLIKLASRMTVAPSALPSALAAIVVAGLQATGAGIPAALSDIEPSDSARAIAASLASGERKGIFLGNFAQQHPRAGQLLALAQMLAASTGAKVGFLTEAANSVGGYLAGALPANGGQSASAMLGGGVQGAGCRAYLLLHAEPELDAADPARARAALGAAEFVVALSPFRPAVDDDIDVLLPVAPFAETAGTFVNCEARVQSFSGVAQPFGQSRPAWKVLRVLGSLLELPQFTYESIEDVRREVLAGLDIPSRLSNAANAELTAVAVPGPSPDAATLERIADVPIYFTDPLVRRSPPLQKTADARPPQARMNERTMAALSLVADRSVRVRQDGGEATLTAARDDTVPDHCVRIAAAHRLTSTLGAMFGDVTVEVA